MGSRGKTRWAPGTEAVETGEPSGHSANAFIMTHFLTEKQVCGFHHGSCLNKCGDHAARWQ